MATLHLNQTAEKHTKPTSPNFRSVALTTKLPGDSNFNYLFLLLSKNTFRFVPSDLGTNRPEIGRRGFESHLGHGFFLVCFSAV
jgi:hypothetical protein